MALFNATVMKWQTKKNIGGRRVLDATNGTTCLLNTRNLDSIRAHGSGGTESSCYYFDNKWDSRDSGAYMELVKTPAQLITLIDTSQNKYVTLPVFPDDDVTATAVNRVVETEYISFALSYGDGLNYSYVYFVDAGWKVVRVLVDYTLAEIVALM
jgi:hypothetical protein